MNEEKILDDINFCLEEEYITPEHYEAIQGLLDLYQKEKFDNKFKYENEVKKYFIKKVEG